MIATPSIEDGEFKNHFYSGAVETFEFHHRARLRLVYVYLCEGNVEAAMKRCYYRSRNF